MPGTTTKDVFERLQSEHTDEQAAACMVLTLHLNKDTLDPQLRRKLPSAMPTLLQLAQNGTTGAVQKNALAALAACVEQDETCLKDVMQPAVVERLLATVAESTRSGDAGLAINAGTVCLAVMSASEEGVGMIIDAQGLPLALELLSEVQRAEGGAASEAPSWQPLTEVLLDVVCRTAASERFRPMLLQQGAVSVFLGQLPNASPEVAVRVLLFLGMMVSSEGVLQQLLDHTAALSTVLQLMRQDDEDCRQLSSDLFRALGHHPETKPMLAAKLKEALAADQ